MRGSLFFLAIVLFVAMLHQPTEADVSISSSAHPTACTIGDWIRYRIVIESSPQDRLLVPGLDVSLGKFEVKDYKVQEQPSQGESQKKVTVVEYVVAAYEVGKLTLPPLTIRWIDAQGKQHKGRTSPITVTIKPTAPPKAKDIKDIKGPISLPLGWWAVMVAAGALVLMVGAVGGGIWMWRRWKARRPAPVSAPVLNLFPHEEALQALAELKAMDLRSVEVKWFYTRLSEIVRRYFERRFGIHALEEPTSLLLSDLERYFQQSAISNQQSATLLATCRRFFSECDLVKFARYPPTIVERQDCLALAEEIVRSTAESLRVLESQSPGV